MSIRKGPVSAAHPLLLPSLLTGVLGALTGLAYLGVLKLLERGLGPQAWAPR